MTLTVLFVFAQILFLFAHCYAENMEEMFSVAARQQLYFSTMETIGLIQFIAAQLLLYAFYIYILWFTVTSLNDLAAPRRINTKLLSIGLWCISIAAILTANINFVPHSFFSLLIRNNILNNTLTNSQYKFIFILTTSIWMLITALALVDTIIKLCKRTCGIKQYITLSLVTLLIFILNFNYFNTLAKRPPASLATDNKPNIFIISFDAMRPDFISYFNNQRSGTPHLSAFLQTSTVFDHAYTPLARTFPSWVGVLTSQYPVQTHIRENMTSMTSLKFDQALPQLLKNIGYETIYATDDSRYNYINNPKFGFDSTIGAPGKKIDLILTTINDFPLSNLITPTPFGKLLFPYNYANHDAPHTYNADNFLELINNKLHTRGTKPLFFAVHFNTTAWPFYWYNDKQYAADTTASVYLYENAIQHSDDVFNKFIQLLDSNGLLKHAIVVIMSDHGIALQKAGDRIVTKALYQGNKNKIFLEHTPYHARRNMKAGDHIITSGEMGIDTSYGYGSDVLSLIQYHSMLAFKLFASHPWIPGRRAEPSSLLDITPTLLDFLHIQIPTQTAGISQLSCLSNKSHCTSAKRPLFLESSLKISEIQKDNIDAATALKQSISYFQIDTANGQIVLKKSMENNIIMNKQRAVLYDHWLLAYYPAAARAKIAYNKNHVGRIKHYTFPSYAVLVNLNTGKWTTDLNSPFAATAPINKLTSLLEQFYGPEMKYYKKSHHAL